MTWRAVRDGFEYAGAPLRLRDIRDSDANLIALWRNSASARRGFFSGDVVTTPDTHVAFMQRRKPHDLIWILELVDTNEPVGMLSLTINAADRCAETGRHFLDERYQGRGLWSEAEWLLLSLAFDLFRLDDLHVELFADNTAMLASQERMGWEGPTPFGERNGRAVVQCVYRRERWEERRAGLLATLIARRAQGSR